MQGEPGPIRGGFHLRARDVKSDSEVAFTRWAHRNDEILPYSIHAHAVFFDKAAANVAHDISRDFDRAGLCQVDMRVRVPLVTPYSDGPHREALFPCLRLHGGLQQQTLTGDLALHLLKSRAQPRTIGCRGNGDAITAVLFLRGCT